MNAFVYILQSETTHRYYCGQTTDIDRRLQQHNDPEYHLSKTTKRFEGPWKLICSYECLNRGKAMALEKKIKKRGISRFIRDLNRQSPA